MTKISQDINYPSALFPKSFRTSVADDMRNNIYSKDKSMYKYRFTSTYIIEAENEEEAKEKFAENSFNFAADAQIEILEKNNNYKLNKTYDK